MKFKVNDLIRYDQGRRAVIIHITFIRGRQRVYFRPPNFNDGRIWSRWNTEVWSAN